MTADGDTEQLRRQLEADAAEWQQRTSQGQSDVGLLDRGQLSELDGWLTAASRRNIAISDAADAFIVASRAAARRGWWPGRSFTGTALAIVLMLMLLFTPIILLFIVVLSAAIIQWLH